MQPSSFHDFLGCREGFGFLAEDCLPHLRGSATSIAPVGCAVDNADRDIVQQEAAAFWHCHDVPAVPISLYSSRFDLFLKNFEFLPVSLQFTFCHFYHERSRPSWSIGRWFGTCENMVVGKHS